MTLYSCDPVTSWQACDNVTLPPLSLLYLFTMEFDMHAIFNFFVEIRAEAEVLIVSRNKFTPLNTYIAFTLFIRTRLEILFYIVDSYRPLTDSYNGNHSTLESSEIICIRVYYWTGLRLFQWTIFDCVDRADRPLMIFTTVVWNFYTVRSVI